MSLFGTVAWPVATLVIAFVFRRDVALALGRVGRLKFRDLEVTFREDLLQAEELARSIPAPLPKDSIQLEIEAEVPAPLAGHMLGDVSESSITLNEGRGVPVMVATLLPREAVEQAWCLVEKTLVRVALAMGDRRASGLSNPESATRFLVDRGRLQSPETMLLGILRKLRDRSRLDPRAPSTEDSQRFVNLASKLTARIEERG